MAGASKGGRRPVIYWAVCPDCFTYIWAEHLSVSREENLDCPYCDGSISLLGGAELSDNCNKLQLLIEEVEQQITLLPAAIDIHRFLSEQVDYIAQAFNDRLDGIQEAKDVGAMKAVEGEARQVS